MCQHTLFEEKNGMLITAYLKCSKCGECFQLKENAVYYPPFNTTVQQVLDSVKSSTWVVTQI